MFSFKKDSAGPTRFMYVTPWSKNNTVIRTNRKIPTSIYIDNVEVRNPIELSSSFPDVTSIQTFWDQSYETSEYKMNYTSFDIMKSFKNNGNCLCLKDDNKNIFATLFSYESDGPIYINKKIQNVRFIEGAVVNHKMKDEILNWLFSWMEYLVPSIYLYTSEDLPSRICSSYVSYKYHGISANFLQNYSTGEVEKINKSEFSKYQEMFIKKYKNNFNFIYNLNSENSDIELYKVPIEFLNNSYYIIGVNNTKKTYKKFKIPVYEVLFCISFAADSDILVNPSEDEKYYTRYAIESVCKAGNYPLLLVSTKEASGDITDYDTHWKKFQMNKKKLYIYNYLVKGFYKPNIYFPK
uniref:Uncharacterized protein n=1 Tax=viral metagenome TaxID=1070528 RepID=A0A6C0D6Z3_9ZZZZ